MMIGLKSKEGAEWHLSQESCRASSLLRIMVDDMKSADIHLKTVNTSTLELIVEYLTSADSADSLSKAVESSATLQLPSGKLDSKGFASDSSEVEASVSGFSFSVSSASSASLATMSSASTDVSPGIDPTSRSAANSIESTSPISPVATLSKKRLCHLLPIRDEATLRSVVDPENLAFLDKITVVGLYDLVLAAHYLDIPPLLDLVAAMLDLKTRDAPEIRSKLFSAIPITVRALMKS